MSGPNLADAEEVGVWNPSLATKINHFPTYVEQTLGFPQLPCAGRRMLLALRQVEEKPAFIEHWMRKAEFSKVESSFVF